MLKIFDRVLTAQDLVDAEYARNSCKRNIKRWSDAIEEYRGKLQGAIDSLPKLEAEYAEMVKKFKAQE